ncbi:MAG: GNAT family N-acetyltransferase [Patescibacteria group bacterium]|nr:GNAT family N-acetyltransferase [Patescibacteria group bacterium]
MEDTLRIEQLKNISPNVLDELIALSRELHKDQRVTTLEEVTAIVHNPNIVLMTAVDNGRIVGMGTLYIIQKLGRRTAYVEDVVVSEACRGKGAGRKIMEALLDAARARGVQSVSLTSRAERVAARTLYESLGFTQYETGVFKLKL